MQFPQHTAFFSLRPLVTLAGTSYQRIIDPKTGYQYEISAGDVKLTCPLCLTAQAAPHSEGLDYECPGCKWQYKVQGERIGFWDPRTVGVETVPLKPGQGPVENLVDAAINDEEKATALRAKSTADWALGKNEDWGKATQVTTIQEKPE